jgi:hypothetical protein
MDDQLDQSWDFLRQRRALREADRDPDAGDVRPPDIVQGYQQ